MPSTRLQCEMFETPIQKRVGANYKTRTKIFTLKIDIQTSRMTR